MGASWESAIVKCDAERLEQIADAAKVLVPLVFKQCLSIDALGCTAALSLWSLECAGFRKKGSLRLDRPVEGVIAEVISSLPTGAQELVRNSSNFALAYIASKVAGRAKWVFFSDSLCQSAAITLSSGSVKSIALTDVNTNSSYGQAAVEALKEFVPSVRYVDDDFFNLFYGENSERRSFTVSV